MPELERSSLLLPLGRPRDQTASRRPRVRARSRSQLGQPGGVHRCPSAPLPRGRRLPPTLPNCESSDGAPGLRAKRAYAVNHSRGLPNVKYLVLILVIVAAYFIIKSHLRKIDRSRHDRTTQDEDMVRCVHCGVHLPRSESVMSGDLYYCTPDHRRLHQGKSE